jgi:hypothetical protein
MIFAGCGGVAQMINQSDLFSLSEVVINRRPLRSIEWMNFEVFTLFDELRSDNNRWVA